MNTERVSITRAPRASLRPFVKCLWATDGAGVGAWQFAERERVLPTGLMHLVFRSSSYPLHLFRDDGDLVGWSLGDAIVGGPRSGHYIRDVSHSGASVGAQLLPGAAELLFGVPASELAERHTRLDDLWGNLTNEVRARLFELDHCEHRLDLFESLLVARLPRIRGLHPAVAEALKSFTFTNDVAQVVKESGYSHRRFIVLFSEAVGLTPKLYCRVQRFQQVLELHAARPELSSVELALEAGYSDQAHFNRQFREFAGVTPGEYSKLSPVSPNHVPVLSSVSG
jgi:AraC-like DNA-binding protein